MEFAQIVEQTSGRDDLIGRDLAEWECMGQTTLIKALLGLNRANFWCLPTLLAPYGLLALLTLLPGTSWSAIDPYFYQVSKGGKVSYVLGTFHEGVSVAELPDYVLERFRQSRQVVLEVDTEGVLFTGRNRVGPSLQSELSPLAWNFLNKRLGRFYSEAEINRMEDWYATREMFATLYAPNLKRRVRLDRQIHQLAKAQEKSIWFLASLKDHIAVYQENKADIEHFARLPNLKEVIIAFQTRYALMVDEFKRRQIDYDDPDRPHPRRAVVIDQRNLKWAPQLEGILAIDSSFVAVGAGHLPGPQGVLSLLEQAGFKVQPYGECDEIILQATAQFHLKK